MIAVAALAIHEARMIGRRAAWPAALVLHALATALFVATWGPSGGVTLWQASTIQQLGAMDRLATSVLLTWLATLVLADDGARNLIDWSALTGRSKQTVLRARILAVVVLGIVFMIVAVPPYVAAAEVSAAPFGELAGHIGAALGFGCFCLGVTAIASVAIDDRLTGWFAAMVFCLVAAASVQLLGTTLTRAIVPAILGAALLALAPLGVRSRRLPDVR